MNTLIMEKSMILCFLLGVISVQIESFSLLGNSFDETGWRNNAKKYAADVKNYILNIEGMEENKKCFEKRVDEIDFIEKGIHYNFDECITKYKRSNIQKVNDCFIEKEKIFHKLINDTEALTKFCDHDCKDYSDNVDKTDLKWCERNSVEAYLFSKIIPICQYWFHLESTFASDDTKIEYDATVENGNCRMELFKSSEIARFTFMEDLLDCRKEMENNVEEIFESNDCSENSIHETRVMMDSCLRLRKGTFAGKLKAEKNRFEDCMELEMFPMDFDDYYKEMKSEGIAPMV